MLKARLELMLVVATLSISTVACGAKGDGDDDDDAGSGGTGASGGTGGSGTGGSSASGGTGGGSSGSGGGAAIVLSSFESEEASEICQPPVTGNQPSCWSFQSYIPGDANYTNVFSDPEDTDDTEAVEAAQELRAASLTWDGGEGQDGMPGRLKLEIPFTDWNQLADIQFNFMGDETDQNWAGKVLRADVMLESGASPNASSPSGAYLLVKTGADYVWAKGLDTNLGPTTAGTWQSLTFDLDNPGMENDGYSAEHVVSIGMQVFSSGGPGDDKPTAAVIYFDRVRVE